MQLLLKIYLQKKDLLFKEDSMVKPTSPYSVSKASADLLVSAYNRTYNFETDIYETINWYLNNQKWIDDIKTGEYKKAYKLK